MRNDYPSGRGLASWQRELIRLTKLSENPRAGGRYRVGSAAGSDGDFALLHHIDVGYTLEGWFLEAASVGRPMCVVRITRNGAPRFGLFTSSPVTFVGENEIRTVNSLYKIEIL
jgi:hypothetical protein